MRWRLPSLFCRERGRHQCCTVKLPIFVCLDPLGMLKSQHLWVTTYTSNLAADGLLFEMDENISEGALISLKIVVAGTQKPIDALAKVSGVIETSKSGRRRVAVRFVDMNPVYAQEIDTYVRSKLQ